MLIIALGFMSAVSAMAQNTTSQSSKNERVITGVVNLTAVEETGNNALTEADITQTTLTKDAESQPGNTELKSNDTGKTENNIIKPAAIIPGTSTKSAVPVSATLKKTDE